MPLKSDYNHIICIMEGETKNIRFVLKIYRFVLRLLNISFCGLYIPLQDIYKLFTACYIRLSFITFSTLVKQVTRLFYISLQNLMIQCKNILLSNFTRITRSTNISDCLFCQCRNIRFGNA